MDKKKNLVSFKTKISIDFFLEIFKIYIRVEMRVIKKESEEQDSLKLQLFEVKENQIVLKKKFKVSDDFKTVNINGITYKIPDYFSRDAIKENDEKTWEMIFYHIFNDDINKEIENLKSTLEAKSEKEELKR